MVPLQSITSYHHLSLVGWLLLMGLVGCGQSGSGNTPALQAKAGGETVATTSSSSSNNGNVAGTASGKSPAPSVDKIQPNPDASLKFDINERDKKPPPPLPEAIAQAVSSPDPSVRFQALDYWIKQGQNAPLDPLLEALEDEDEEVRAKAAKIAEQQWGIKQEED
jgi:HEAT repeats